MGWRPGLARRWSLNRNPLETDVLLLAITVHMFQGGGDGGGSDTHANPESTVLETLMRHEECFIIVLSKSDIANSLEDGLYLRPLESTAHNGGRFRLSKAYAQQCP